MINKEERDSDVFQSYDFEKLCQVLITQENPPNSKLQNGLSQISDLREQFFRRSSKQCISDNEHEVMTSHLIEVFKELEIPLNVIHEIGNMTIFNEDEVLLVHEKLSQEKRNFCCLGPECYHKTVLRSKDVDVVLKQFQELNQRNPKGNSTVFIDGEPGVGKSELARQVAEACWKSDSVRRPDVVMVVNAETEETLLLSYVQFAKELLCNFTHVENAITSPGLMIEERIRLLKHIIGTQLKKHSHWLVVIDNINHYDSYSSYWPSPGSEDWGRGHILVTLPDIGNIDKSFFFFSSGHMTLANGMDSSQAVQLLCKVSNVKSDNSTLRIAELLNFHPLALACAAMFVRYLEKENTPWKRYIELFNKHNKETARETLKPYSDSCSTAINMVLTQLRSQSQESVDIERLLSIIRPLAIKKEKIVDSFKDLTCTNFEQHLHQLSPFLSIESKNGETDSIVLRHQVIDRNSPEFEMNRVSTLISSTVLLAHELSGLKNTQSVPNNNSICIAASHLASQITKLTDKEMTEFIDQLNEKVTTKAEAVDILLVLAQQCRFIQKLEQSAVFLTVAKEILEREGTFMNVLLFGEVLYRLGITLRDMGESNAKKHLENALDIFVRHKDLDNDKVTQLMTALGDVALTCEDITKAKTFYQKALKTCSEQSNNNTVAFCCFKLGNVFAIERSFQLAKEHYEKALNLMDNINFVELSKVLTCVGAMSVCVEDYELALDYLEKAMSIEKRLYSKFHPCRQNAIKNAANACKALKDTDYAEKLLKESLEISQNVTCSSNVEVARVFSQLGSLKSSQGDLKSAIECYTNALQIQSSTLHCHVDPGIADNCCDLGDVYASDGELEMARSLHERALGIRGLIFKPDHPDIGTSYFRLGKVYTYLDDHQTAQSLLERAVEIRGKIFGVDHPETLDSMYYLGYSHARLGNFQNAKNLYETVLQEQEKLTESRTALAKTTESLAETNLGLGDVNKAKEQFKRAVELQRSEVGEDHSEVARPLVRLALVHEHCNEIGEAKTLLEKALYIYRKNICSVGRSRAVIIEAHLKRVMSKLPHKGCVVM